MDEDKHVRGDGDVNPDVGHDAARVLNGFAVSSPSPSPSTSLMSNSSNRVAIGKFLMVYYVVTVGVLVLPVVFNRLVR